MKLPSKLLKTAIALLPALGLSTIAQAAVPEPVGPDAGRCTSTGVIDTSRVLGYCIADGVKKAWFRTTHPNELIALKPLEANRSCDSGFLSNNVMTGTCDRVVGTALEQVPVFWPVASPKSEPKPLQPLALDTAAEVSATTLFGNVAGRSASQSGSTAVIWPFKNDGVPIQVSARNDNCRVTSVADSEANGSPVVALNCPQPSGNFTANVSTLNGSAYVMKPLKLPNSATYCEVTGINSHNQAAGTCHYTNNTTVATLWSGFDAEPKTLVSTDNFSTEAVFLNDTGSVLANALAPNQKLPVLWSASAANGQQVPIPKSFDFCLANALALSVDTVLMTCSANDLAIPVTAYAWSPHSGLIAIKPAPGAGSYRGTAITNTALDVVGHFKAEPQANFHAFISRLP